VTGAVKLSPGRVVSRSSAGLLIRRRSSNHKPWKLFRASQILSTVRCIDEFFQQPSVHDVVNIHSWWLKDAACSLLVLIVVREKISSVLAFTSRKSGDDGGRKGQLPLYLVSTHRVVTKYLATILFILPRWQACSQVERASDEAGIAAHRTLKALHVPYRLRLACRRAKFRAPHPLPDDAASILRRLIGCRSTTAGADPLAICPPIGPTTI
jgi:hypothetical protein